MRSRDAIAFARVVLACAAAGSSLHALTHWEPAFPPPPLAVAAALFGAGALVLARGVSAPFRLGLAALAVLGLLHAALTLIAAHVPPFPGGEWLVTPFVVAAIVGAASGATVATWSSPVPAGIAATAISVVVWIAAEAHYGLFPPPTALGCLLAILACIGADVACRARTRRRTGGAREFGNLET